MSILKHERALVHPQAIIGEETRIWANVNILKNAIIGSHCNICDGCFIEGGAVVGNHVTLKNGVSVFEGVTIQDDVFVGAGVVFINDRYPRSNRKDAWTLEKTIVKHGATIGANATLMCGLTIGEYAVIGAGAVVTKDVGNHCIVVGNPACFVAFACRCGRKLSVDFKCACGLKYQLEDRSIKLV